MAENNTASGSQDGMTRRDAASGPDEANRSDIDPVELLRAMLAISPEDATAVREDAAEAMKPGGSERGEFIDPA